MARRKRGRPKGTSTGHCAVSKRGKRKGTKCSGKTRSACKAVKSCAWKA